MVEDLILREAVSSVITFEVVKESYGWAVRRDRQMMTPMWCRASALAEAERMVATLRRHGARAEVRVRDPDDAAPGSASPQ